jgi:hypothetical protein
MLKILVGFHYAFDGFYGKITLIFYDYKVGDQAF